MDHLGSRRPFALFLPPLLVPLLALPPLLLAACAPDAPPVEVGRRVEGVTLQVPGDYPTIGAALAAAGAGDTIAIAPGDYVESLSVPAAVALVGAGPEQTVLHGTVALGAAGASVRGMRLTAIGATVSASAPGILGTAASLVIAGNWIEDFGVGVRLNTGAVATVDGNVLRRNGVGVQAFEAGAATIVNNHVLYNSKGGVWLSDSPGVVVAHNTVVGNGFGATPDNGGAGVVTGNYAAETVRNNVLVSNNGGLHCMDVSRGDQDHNLVWGNVTNYSGTAAPGAGDVSLDPRFVDAQQGDFHLAAASPAIDVGLPGLADHDFDGVARPQGAAPDLGAHEHRPPPATTRLVVSEVMANPVDESRGEFVEVFNLGDTAVDLAGLILSDGDARDVLVAFGGGTTVLAPGAYGVIVDPDYTSGYDLPAGVTTVTVGNTTLGNGLTTTDPVSLYSADGVTLLASYSHPFDPGNGISAERVDLYGPDTPANWRASPCLQSAGRPNCAPVTLASGLVISEVMANPLDETTGEFVELYNGTDAAIDAGGMKLADGQSTDVLQGFKGGTTVIPPRSYAVVLDPDWPDGQLFRIDPAAVLLTVGDTALGNGLAVGDSIVLTNAAGQVLDTYSHPLAAANGKSIEKVSLSQGDVVGNWAQSSCPEGSSPGRLNCVSAASAGVRKPLLITEVMANPRDEDRGEFVELYNRGVDPVDAAGLLLTDGDATDALQGFGGGTTVIPAGGFAVILDAEYAGGYDLPAEAVLLTTGDTTLGSGLGISDEIRLLEANGVEIIDTFRFPFNPGNGISAERVDLRAFDSPANWTASTCPSGSSPGRVNCAAAAAGLPKKLRITEVMANMAGAEGSGEGELVEILNLGSLSVDLGGMTLESGPDGGTMGRDEIVPFGGGDTVLRPGGYAVVLDPQYDGRYAIPAGTLLVTISDNNFGTGSLATTHVITLYDADGITPLDKFRYPSDPGDGVSLSRLSLTAVDSAANWAATPCGATPGAASCASGDAVTSYVSTWLDRNASEGGIYWFQAIGWPTWGGGSCDERIVCTGGAYGHDFRDNFPAPAAFSFTNPYPQHTVTFVERASPTDTCTDPCSNPATAVPPGQTVTVPASALGYYFAVTSGPTLNSLDWFGGDPSRYWDLPPDGTLAPFSVEVVKP
jgi:parallel beta-helix repeat protein